MGTAVHERAADGPAFDDSAVGALGHQEHGEPQVGDESRRTNGIARLFYPGRHARRSTAAPGEEIYRLIGQLVDPDDIMFFDWSPPDADATVMAGDVVLMTARTITHLTYRPSLGDSEPRPVATDIAVHRLDRVRSLHWSAEAPHRKHANGRRHARCGVVIVGDDWEVTVSAAGSAELVPDLIALLRLT